MKTVRVLLIAIVMVALCGCSDATRRGTRLGDNFIEQWHHNGDLQQFTSAIAASGDSLSMDWQRASMRKAFVERVKGVGNDTMTIAAQALALDRDVFAEAMASSLIEALLHDDAITPAQAGARLSLVYGVIARVGLPDRAEAYHAALERHTGELSLADQMRVYSRAATPAELGRQLAAERAIPGADTALVTRRIEVLASIYDKQQYDECVAAYNSNK